MKHLTEEELIERYYGEDEADAALHLEGCRECAATYAALQADLAEIGTVEPPLRDDVYGEQIWSSLSQLLPTYSSHRQTRLRIGLWLSLSAATACAILVAAAFYAGRVWEHRQIHPTVANSPKPPEHRVVVVLLSDHLDRSERLLVQLKHIDADDTEMIPTLRDEARRLLAANRTYQEHAEEKRDPATTEALDHLNRLLTEFANQPDDLDAAAITRLQHQMEADGLLFEVRVLRSRLPDRHAEPKSRLKGGEA
jgi:hypothetical protein